MPEASPEEMPASASKLEVPRGASTRVRGWVMAAARALVPAPQRQELRYRLRRLTHPAWLGTLRRTVPLSERWGWDRGTPVDRYYIAQFLAEHRGDIQGDVLEVQECLYTQRFGTEVRRCDVLDINASNPRATVIADLTTAASIPDDRYDCFILTQTLQFIFDARSALAQTHRILRPGGVLLATVPVVSRVDRPIAATDYWRFTPAACERMFGEAFGAGNVTVRACGNVLTGTAFLNGIAAEELSRGELEAHHRDFPLLVCIRAMKA